MMTQLTTTITLESNTSDEEIVQEVFLEKLEEWEFAGIHVVWVQVLEEKKL